jgi:hypothetical protein
MWLINLSTLKEHDIFTMLYKILISRLNTICIYAAAMMLVFWGSYSFAADWVPIKDVSLMIEKGSILDFSNLMPPAKSIDSLIRINQQGQFAIQNNSENPQRFLIGSLPFSIPMGGIPDHGLIDTYIQQFRMHGYNMARLDFLEAILMEGRKSDFDYNPEQLDRFYYLVAALKKNGIYLILNGLSNDNGGYGNITERWIGKKQLHLGVYFNAEKQLHWKKLLATMYGSTNPYTGISVLKDPTLAGIILVNEGGLVFINRQGVDPSLKPYFSNWLKIKYGSNNALKAAWGKELKSDENVEAGLVGFPLPDAWTSKRMADTQQFFFETEKNTAAWMTQFLREQGYKGLVTSYNNWNSPAANASRGQLEWIDMHNYFAHPEYISAQEMRVRQDSMLTDGAEYIRNLASAKHIGKPFTVSEHGQVFWNSYRRENGIALPAYAALQGWDAICQHSGAVSLSYNSTSGKKLMIYPFAVGVDPIARATETLAALLYLRGDVAAAKHKLGVSFGATDAFEKSAHLGSMPADISKLSLLTGVGLDWQSKTLEKSKQTGYDGQIELNQPGLKVLKNGVLEQVKPTTNLGLKLDSLVKDYAGNLAYKLRKVNVIADERWAARVQNLREAKFIDANNLTDPTQEVYQSDTGEIVLDSQQNQMTVITPNTEAIVFNKPKPIALKQFSIISADSAALVAVSAMDNQPLKTSKRILVVLSTDARNTDMRFSDEAETTSLDLGKPPVIIRVARMKLALKNANKSQLKVFSINLRGQRQDAINVKQTDSSIEFELDISKLRHGATTYFEITV